MVGSDSRTFVVGISGASGAAYALRTLEQLLLQGHQVHLVVSDYGRRLLAEESGVTRIRAADLLPHLAPDGGSRDREAASEGKPQALSVAADPPDQSTGPSDEDSHAAARTGRTPDLPVPPNFSPERDFEELASRLVCHPNKDVGAVIASGSFRHHGMVIVPCSSASLGAIATGSGSNLLSRAAAVTLKERRPLVIAHRESPLNLPDIENMRTLTLAGATIAPTNPGLYLHPRSVQDIVDFIAGKMLDLLDVDHDLDTRWTG